MEKSITPSRPRRLLPIAARSARAHAIALCVLVSLAAAGQDSSVAKIHWSTYLGGTGNDQVLSMAVDSFGHVYVAGRVSDGVLLANDTSGRSGLIHQAGFGGGNSDAFIAQYAPQGSMLWCSYFGGPGDDEAVQVVVTGMDGVYVVGNTTSASGIATDSLALQGAPGGGSDVFIARFTDYGLLQGATYFGGADNEYASGAALDAHGRLLVSGKADGPGGLADPVRPFQGGTDGLLLLYQGTDSLVAGTYLGGEADDELVQVAAGDSSGAVLLGNTASTTGIATPGAFTDTLQGGTDAFVLKVDTNLAVTGGSYFGGPGNDSAAAMDRFGGRWAICGATASGVLYTDTSSHQPANAGNGDGFIAELDGNLALQWSTFLGDSAYDALTAISFDDAGRLYAAGITASDTGIATPMPQGNALQGDTDAFVLHMDSGQVLVWARYVGAMGRDEAGAMAVARHTSVFLGGRTTSTHGVTHSAKAHQIAFGGGLWDGTVHRVDQKRSSACTGICVGGEWSSNSPPLPEYRVCLGDSVTFIQYGGALGYGSAWMWYADECGVPSHYLTTGDTITLAPTHSFMLYVRAEGLDDVTSCAFIYIHVYAPPHPSALVADTACAGGSIACLGTGAEGFAWHLAGTDSTVEGNSAEVPAPLAPGMHAMQITANNGGVCFVQLEDSVMLLPRPEVDWAVKNATCSGGSDGMIAADSVAAALYSFLWLPDSLAAPARTGLDSALYVVRTTGPNGCARTDSLHITAPPPLIDSVATTGVLCDDPMGTAQVFTSSTAPGLAFDWGSGPDTLAFAAGLDIGTHSVAASDSAGCQQQVDFLIGGHHQPAPQLTAADTVCPGGTIALQGSGADAFTWQLAGSTAQGDSAQLAAPATPGSYAVHVTAINGDSACIQEVDLPLTVLAPPAPAWTVADVNCAGGSDGSIALDSAAAAGLSFTWEPAWIKGPGADSLPAGCYIATTTDLFGCSATDSLTVLMPPPLMDSLDVSGALCGRPTGTAAVFTASTAPGLAFNWGSGPDSSTSLCGLAPGSYTVTATDSAGCQQQLAFTVPDIGSISVSIAEDTLPEPAGGVWLACTIAPADSGATFLWVPGTGLDDPAAASTLCTAAAATLYVVQATSSLGCTATDSVLVLPLFNSAPPPSGPCGEVFVPDHFSPNGDGLNDTFGVLGGCFTSLALHVYDRWGGEVFRATDAATGWDGTHHGSALPAGAYVFTLSAVRTNGQAVERTGIITLVR